MMYRGCGFACVCGVLSYFSVIQTDAPVSEFTTFEREYTSRNFALETLPNNVKASSEVK